MSRLGSYMPDVDQGGYASVDFERRGLVPNQTNLTYDSDTELGTETQYLVSGSRLVWKTASVHSGLLTREQRLTYALSNLIQSTSAVVDLLSGDLLEHATFYPNGARETHRTTDVVSLQLEPMGFTDKEADEEVGLVYFGERYLIPHLGRWSTPDPLHIHASGGGEALNSYHYVSGNLLQARDPLGLECGSDCRWARQNGAPFAASQFAEADRRAAASDRLAGVQDTMQGIADQFHAAKRDAPQYSDLAHVLGGARLLVLDLAMLRAADVGRAIRDSFPGAAQGVLRLYSTSRGQGEVAANALIGIATNVGVGTALKLRKITPSPRTAPGAGVSNPVPKRLARVVSG